MLAALPEGAKAALRERLREAVRPYETPTGVEIPGVTLIASARRELISSLRMESDVARLAAFSSDPRGGNPAGVYVCGELPPPEAMQEIAREVGYSETAFLAGDGGADWQTRYFSPEAEVAFCGHATIAAAVHLHGRFGTPELAFETAEGVVRVAVDASGTETLATLTSVKPHVGEIGPSLLARLLALLGFEESELDPALPVRLAFAGVHHPIIALASRETHERMEYDFDGLRALMLKQDWTTSRSSGAPRRPASARATHSRSQASSRILPRAPPPRRSAPTCARSAPSRPRP